MEIKTFAKHLNRAFLKKAAALIFCAALSSACSDQGCIDADDFGEYESQTLEIPANASAESCNYDFSKGIDSQGITDTAHGSGIKGCLTSGSTTITDETGVQQTNSGDGCIGFTDAKFKNLCINNCIQLCNSNSSGTSASAEPFWVSTDKKKSGKNIGVTIRPGSQVIVRAIGSVVLGDAVDYPDIFVQADNPAPHTKDKNWDDIFFDARGGQSVYLKIGGRWLDGAEGTETTSTIVGGGNVGFGTANDNRIYNGAKRVVAYLIPHPTGYNFDITQTNEKAGTKDVPLLPDPAAWQCSFSGSDKKQSACGTSVNGYTAAGYTNANDGLSSSIFPVSSNVRSIMLSQYGGIIRWDNDGIENDLYDPFAANSVICNGANGNCSGINGVPGNQGRLVGNLAGGAEITNTNKEAYKVSLRSLTGDIHCNVTLNNLTVRNSAGVAIRSIDNVAINNNNWTSAHITLEPSQKLVISSNSITHPSGSVNCGMMMGIRFAKHHDIAMEQSGFVKFTSLRGAGNCNLKGRIINPNGSSQDIDTAYTADFYEHDSFDVTGSVDPLANLAVPASPALGTLNWSEKVYVRKGQIIRFSPESWNSEWTTSSGLQRQCGVGMAMSVEPRPAVLCRGKATDTIDNPLCIPNLNNNGTLIGCQALDNRCSDTSSSSNYCPPTCQRTITCSNPGTVSNNFQRSGCNYSGKPSACTYPTDLSFTDAMCVNCANLMVDAASLPAKLDINAIDQCYDLENYKGKVSNISKSNGQTKASVDAFLADTARAKGLKKLTSFNGDYGNLATITNTNAITDTSGTILYPLQLPLSFVKSGRLKFFMLDGDDFNGSSGALESYDNNSGSGGSFGGSNGYKIKLSGTLEFSNGTWLQARLCQEPTNDDTSVACKSSNPIPLSNQPTIIEITAPTSTTPAGAAPTLTGNYKFDDYGNIVRTTAGNLIVGGANIDCTQAANGVETLAGVLFYCHTYRYFSQADLKAKSENERNSINSDIQRLRLTFKILDPEVGNCTISSPNDGIRMNNPFYDTNVTGAAGAICSSTERPGNSTTESPGTCQKQFYCANKYSNNSGKYFVNVKVKNPSNGSISSIIGSVIQPVVEVMDGKKDDPSTPANEATMGQAERVYKLLISDPRYKTILMMSLVVMFTFYGFGYLIGAVELSHSDIINRIIKIGLIYLFVGETGWYWFEKIVVKFFKDSTDYLAFMMASSFDDSPELSNAIATGQYYDKSLLFSSVDKVFSLFFSSAVQKKVSALLFASIFGWAYLLILYSSFMLYVYAVANAVLLYLTAQVFISILFVLGPIFFVFTLFSQTKDMFDNWLKQLIGFSLQQIFLLTTLAFFNMLMYEVIKMSLGYKICWDEVWTINIITRITLLSFWSIASLPPRTNAQSEVGNIGNPEGIPSLFTILFIWVIASLMEKFIGFMTDLASSISGGLKASDMGSGVAGFAKKMKGLASDNAKKFLEKTGAANAIRKLDKGMFDSGKLAEEERTKKRKQNAADLNNKSAMSKAGDKAVSDYKKKNGKELMGMTAEQQRDKLKSVRDTAMNSEGKKLGLSDDQIKALKADKGLKYVDTNVFGAALQAARQAAMSGGSLRQSIDDRAVATKFSHSESQAALKQMTSAERKQFINAAKQGKVEIGKSKLDAMASAKKEIGRGLKSAGNAMIKAVYDKDYKNAADQLVKEGKINQNSLNATRPDSEKAMIRQRQKANALQKKVNKPAASRAIAELEREDKYLAEQQEIDESSSNAVAKGAKSLGKYISRGANRINPFSRGDQKKARNDIRGATRKQLSSDLNSVREERAGLKAESEAAYQEHDAAQQELRSSDIYNQMTDLETKVNEGNGESGDKEKLERLRKEVSSDEKLSKAQATMKKSAMAIHQISAQQKNLAAKESSLQSFASNMDSASRIRNAAIEEQVHSSSNDAMKTAFDGVETGSDQFNELVDKYSDDIFTSGSDASKINDSYQKLTSADDYKDFVNKNDKNYSSDA